MTPCPTIVLEGPDGVGKTTLAEKISGATGMPIVHQGPPENPHPAWYVQTYADPVFTGPPFIADRWHLGEHVYGPLMDRPKHTWTDPNSPQRHHVDMTLAAVHASVHLLKNPVAVLQHRMTLRGDDFIKPEQLPEIVRRYRHVELTSHFYLWGHVTASQLLMAGVTPTVKPTFIGARNAPLRIYMKPPTDYPDNVETPFWPGYAPAARLFFALFQLGITYDKVLMTHDRNVPVNVELDIPSEFTNLEDKIWSQL